MLEWRLCTLIRFSVADGFDANLASLFVVSNSMKVWVSVLDGFLRVVQVSSLLRKEFLCCVARCHIIGSIFFVKVSSTWSLAIS
jgi:hypothetical protein